MPVSIRIVVNVNCITVNVYFIEFYVYIYILLHKKKDLNYLVSNLIID